jgi:hypothetical protein
LMAATYFICDETTHIFGGDFCRCSWRFNRGILRRKKDEL